MLRRSLIVFALMGMCSLPGCGGASSSIQPTAVQGTVMFDGKGLPEGTVNFSSTATGNGAIAKLGAEGKFVVTGGVVPGDYKVTITPPTPTPENPMPVASAIPDKYRSESTSDLICKIVSGSNELKFELKP